VLKRTFFDDASQNEPLAFATIVIHPQADSTNIRGVVSENSGAFIVNIAAINKIIGNSIKIDTHSIVREQVKNNLPIDN